MTEATTAAVGQSEAPQGGKLKLRVIPSQKRLRADAIFAYLDERHAREDEKAECDQAIADIRGEAHYIRAYLENPENPPMPLGTCVSELENIAERLERIEL